jgi:hypothetical protein
VIQTDTKSVGQVEGLQQKHRFYWSFWKAEPNPPLSANHSNYTTGLPALVTQAVTLFRFLTLTFPALSI